MTMKRNVFRNLDFSHCPDCGKKGTIVKPITLHSLLKPEVQSRILDANYWFCTNPECNTVYYSENGNGSFLKSDMQIKVGIKEKTPPRHVCYCFDHTIEEIEDEVHRTSTSTVLDDIKTRMKNGCFCVTKSPMGACCLGTVSKYVNEAIEKYGER